MKQGWEIKKLGEVCELSAGGDVPKNYFSEIQNEKYQIPIYANGEKNEGLYGYTTIAKIVKPSITISARGTIGFSVKRLKPFFPIVRLIVVSPIDLKKLSLDFLDYTLRKIDFKHSGSSIPQLTVPMIRDYKIPLPPLPEQQRIVSILDACFAAIDKAKSNAEQNLKNAKELFESYLQGVFEKKGDSWEEKKLGELCNIIGGGTPSKANSKFYDGDIFWATVRDMKGEVISDTEHKITKEAVKNSSTNIIPKENVIIATRVGLGKVCLIENDTAINQDLRGVVPINSKKLSVDFLYHWFKSIAHKIVEEGTGATVQGVKLPFIKSLAIPLPPLQEQQTIVRQLDALRAETQKLEAVYQKKIADLDELKKSILQKAFSGELSELGFDGLKDDRIIDGKKEILQSSNLKNHNSDDDGLKDDRILKEKV